MKRFILTVIALTAAITISFADNIRFASHPSLSPDGKQIYFSYDGDIYSVPVGGGQATAVITMPGVQDSPLV
ncbi:MAG: PD40 domain-containing protein, partial [Bacteroidales bacterium]|nr:PD40 domain-containing protein [Bacteroidales bacterium]